MAESPIRILLVEDNPADQRLVAELLGGIPAFQHRLVPVSRLDAALAAVRAQTFDVILLDLGLPDSQGFASLSRMHECVPAAPVIVLTARSDDDAALRAARQGAEEYLVKDQLTGHAIVRTIRYAIERGRSEAALRASERRLQESEERVRLAVDSTDLGMFDFYPGTGQLIWSATARRHFGLDLETPVTYDTFLSGLHEDDRERVDGIVQRVLRGIDDGRYATEYRTIGLTDARERWLSAWGRVYFDPQGQPVRFIGMTLDITDRKRAEQELLDADRRKTEFLATLAHELRNPLAPVRFAVRHLQSLGEPGPGAHHALSVIDRQVTQLVRLIDDLLDVSRITYNKIHLRAERVSLAEVMRASVESVQPLIDAAGHTLHLRLPAADAVVRGDPARLVQVFSNLLNNAVKFTPPGGAVWFDAHREGDQFLVQVGDSGVGLSHESLPHLFEMFRQGEERPEHGASGLGIGLTLAKRLVEMHHGTIEARSAGPGTGAQFIITLPAVRDAADGDRSPRPAMAGMSAPIRTDPAAAARPLRVLVVDDNADAAEMLKVFLSALGHRTALAYDGHTALERAESFRPEVVVLDIGLPGQSGFAVARAIRERTASRNTFLIAATGWGQEEDRRNSRAAGFDFHLVKPVEPDALERLLTEIAHTMACAGCERCIRRGQTRARDSQDHQFVRSSAHQA